MEHGAACGIMVLVGRRLFKADAAALLEHMAGVAGETVGASMHAHCATTL